MPKIKTHSGTKKRSKISKNGKVIHGHTFRSHVLNEKSTKYERTLRQAIMINATNAARVKRTLLYG